MNCMIVLILTLCAVVFAKPRPGYEAPGPQIYTYNVPSVAKIALPGPVVTKNVETYSAPSIEKTTTITRTITAPIQAPAAATVQYSAPAAPVFAAAPVAAHAAPFDGYGYAGSFGGIAPFASDFGYGGGIGGQTVYNAPSLGYDIGYGASAAIAGPALATYAAPAVYAAPAYAAPAFAEYGAPAAVVKGGY